MPEYYETAGHVIAASLALPVVDIFAVALKFRTRQMQKQPLKADDWLLVPATLLVIGIGVTLTYGAMHKALGWPLQIPPNYQEDPSLLESDQLTLARKVQYAFLMMLPLALGLVKASFLFLYKRIFSINRRAYVLLVSIITLVIAWTIAFFFAEMFQCSTKFWANWSSTHVFRTQCNQTTWIVFAVCLTGFLLDLVIITLPIPHIWQLKLSTRKKFAVTSIFLLGTVTVVASLVRLIFITQLVFQLYDINKRFVNITTSVYWGIVEAGVGIFVACLPTLQFLIRKRTWRALSRTATTSSTRPIISISQFFRPKPTSKPTIQVEYTVDVAYANKDSNPILTGSETWVHNNRSEEGGHDIEMRMDISKAEPVEIRPAY